MVSLCDDLIGLRNFQTAGKALTLGLSVRMFLEEINIWVGRLSKVLLLLLSRSVMSDPVRPHGLQPTRLLHSWDFPGKSTGVGCHCLLRSPVQMGLFQFVGGPIRAKHGGRMNLLSLFELGHPFCPALRHWQSCLLDFQTWTRTCAINPYPLILEPFGFRLILVPSAPLVFRSLNSDWIIPLAGSPACRWLTRDLLGPHNCISQFLW